ncbi:serine hydrolase domain-containing protein [Arthrobacter sp. JSM 101049]|uniref:serine hydrolase domain-containing protein n=1 Tax=Arthrobacter sp. JSM 101049 TaxID=929097 RepID=UPI0035667C4F
MATNNTVPATANPAIAAWASVLAYAPRFLEHLRGFARQPGYQVAVAVDGNLLGACSGGFADVASGVPMDDGHQFRIASHSKMFTATAILQLADAGALTLEDALADHLPELAGTDAADVTVGELLSHSSGLTRDGADSDFWVLGRAFPDRASLLDTAAHGRVIARHEHFKYTNIGYGLLGLVIEAASGLDYRAYTRGHLVEPLGLRHTGPDLDAGSGRLATGYGSLTVAGEPYTLEHRTVIDHIDTGALSSATGFYATASDVVRFLSALLPEGPGRAETGTVLGEHSKRRMQRKVESSGTPGRHYGLGLILQDVHGQPTFGHSGGYPGHITRSWALPETGAALSVLTNAIDGPATSWGEQLIALATLSAREAPASSSGMPGAERARFTGRFAGLWGVQDIVELGGKLYCLEVGSPPDPETTEPLDVLDGSRLRSRDPNGFAGYGEELVFEFDDAGAAAFRGPGGMRMVRQADYRVPERLADSAR